MEHYKIIGDKDMLKGKTVLVGITGGIAAYKAAELTSLIVKQHANVEVIMTRNATEFITPLTFEHLTGNKVYTDTFDRNFVHNVEHIALANKANMVVIAPATANIIAKATHGIADDMLSTTVLACTCPKMVAPAMNTNMYINPITQDNITKLKDYGWIIAEPVKGRLACGTTGLGKLQDAEDLLQYILKEIALPHDLLGKKVLVTAGATQESIDPVRYITNHSTGKMGYALAQMAAYRGADVVLISGKTHIKKPKFVEVIEVRSMQELFEAVKDKSLDADFIFKAAAVADYTPINYYDNKMKKNDEDLIIKLKRTTDILSWLGRHSKNSQVICGFSMETENMLENSKKKLINKNIDMICANNLKLAGAGFGTDTNIVTVITQHSVEEMPIMSKDKVANKIIDKAIDISKQKAK